jgi:arginine/ornithine N-succinyltransferase beta subunit
MLTLVITQQMDILFIGINPQIFASDVILIYRMSGTIDSNTPIWQLIRGLFSSLKVLDYDFDFSKILLSMLEVLMT